MFKWTLTLGLMCLGVLAPLTQQVALPEDPYYTAGVVEFRPATSADGTALEQMQDNLRGYLTILKSAEAQATDIIVFPESTLNNRETVTFVPDPQSFTSPLCIAAADERAQYEDFLVQLSCQARAADKYVVINLTEKEKCSANAAFDPRPCASNDLNIYNTNVVFDREGRVISRYRKVNLYDEPKNTTYLPNFGVFDTDFGVRFGHFVCFDILFYTPAQEVVEKMGIHDFLFPTMWFSQLPFLTAVQAQFAWAYANDVNFLAAGASLPAIGSTGTSILHGRRGALVQVMNQGKGERQLYVAKVPKLSQSQRYKRATERLPAPTPRLTTHDIFLKRDYLERYHSVAIELTGIKGTTVQRICQDTFCCQFVLNWHALDGVSVGSRYYTYRLGVFAGMRNEQVADTTNDLRNCAVFTCTGDDITDCGKTFVDAADEKGADLRVEPQVAFENIEIVAEFPDAPHFLLQPNSLRDDLLPLHVNEFEWGVEKWLVNDRLKHRARFALNTTTANLLAFSIYGNYYDGGADTCCPDTPVPDDDGASALLLSTALLWTLTLAGVWLA